MEASTAALPSSQKIPVLLVIFHMFRQLKLQLDAALHLLPPLEELKPLSLLPSAPCSDISSRLFCTPSVAKF